MAQRDYIRRCQKVPSRRKKNNLRKKQSSLPAILSMLVVIAATALVAFMGGLCFITHNKEDTKVFQNEKITDNGLLPPKPEERWRYIRELESRRPGMHWPTESFMDSTLKNTDQLVINEQYQRQLQHQKQTTALKLRQDLPLQAPVCNMCNTAQQSKMQSSVPPITCKTEASKQIFNKRDKSLWMIQCGSFKGVEQAETVRVQLAFEGFNSRITANNGWNRIMIGPVEGKKNTDGIISRLKIVGHSNCIRLAHGG